MVRRLVVVEANAADGDGYGGACVVPNVHQSGELRIAS